MPDWDMNGYTTTSAYQEQIHALSAECDQAGATIHDLSEEREKALKIMRSAYTALAFAFTRLHGSARTQDGELCSDLQKIRADIEAHFRDHGVSL